jgi:hypothetical protein
MLELKQPAAAEVYAAQKDSGASNASAGQDADENADRACREAHLQVGDASTVHVEAEAVTSHLYPQVVCRGARMHQRRRGPRQQIDPMRVGPLPDPTPCR